MRLLFVVDGRSPIALIWIRYFVERGDEVHLVSTFACQPDLDLASLTILPVAFSGLKARQPAGLTGKSRNPLWGSSMVRMRTWVRQWLGPLSLSSAARRMQPLVERVRPDLIHAMRIPFEGMLASHIQDATPLLISIWGNDFTLHASATPWMGRLTRQALGAASAVHADCQRDIRLAFEWGFPRQRPVTVLPGAGGIQLDVFHPTAEMSEAIHPPWVINPRGIRAYIRNEPFFKAIPLVLAQEPETQFICTGMAGQPQAEGWVRQHQVADNVQLLGLQTRQQMAELFRRAQVSVSPSVHDGTPNTLLEAMACGTFPVAGDLESLREWITPGVNGLLVDPDDPEALAKAILQALQQPDLRRQARKINTRLVEERAEYGQVMHLAAGFYEQLVK
ncbi:MAG: glycosyltransferase family 4 protein [Anaerolineales bacterium]